MGLFGNGTLRRIRRRQGLSRAQARRQQRIIAATWGAVPKRERREQERLEAQARAAGTEFW